MTTLFKQTWWDNNLSNSQKFGEYLGWLGNESADSRIFIRENIKDLGIKSLADFGCGPCVEYTALTSEGYDFEYLGIDSCVHLKEINESKGIPFLNAPVENTGLDDNSYELSYSRHVLEHLPTFKDALTEMIRVASKYVVHIFFMKPGDEDKENYWEAENLYHNNYSISSIESFLNENEKVKSFEWIDINKDENALIINLVEEEE
jgi:ubiquinone/menaquinone biosynthesis C-methylase UbiE